MKIQDVKKIALFGAGTMGPGLAQVFVLAGFNVSMYSRKAETLDKALAVIKTNLNTLVEKGVLARTAVNETLARITPTQSIEEAATNADFVIESIVEKLEEKKKLYEALDQICSNQTVFTSNTSYLNIFEVMPSRRLAKTAIAHWFAPPHVIPLVEVVKGPETSQETVDFTVELLKSVNKVPIVMERFVPGFCINRLLRIIGREVFFQLDNGYITADQLDLAVKASIIPRAMVLGFVQRYDFTGLDLSARNLQNAGFIEPPIDNAPSSLVERVARGELGVKSGKGFYDYSDRKLEEVLKERDQKLMEVFENVQDLIYKRI
ncbi:MAG: mmgB 1 [Firmicutes bacterium]|nr:mmgB 1 [Bacillota bacterium]